METKKYQTTIQARKEKIWHTLFDDATYRQWTAPFHEGSYAETDWTEGSKARFLTPEGDGMVSRIAVHRPNEYMVVEHLGSIKNGVEDTSSAEAKAWTGAKESYRLEERNGGVTLTVESDVTADYSDYFDRTWPKALDKLKELAEQ